LEQGRGKRDPVIQEQEDILHTALVIVEVVMVRVMARIILLTRDMEVVVMEVVVMEAAMEDMEVVMEVVMEDTEVVMGVMEVVVMEAAMEVMEAVMEVMEIIMEVVMEVILDHTVDLQILTDNDMDPVEFKVLSIVDIEVLEKWLRDFHDSLAF